MEFFFPAVRFLLAYKYPALLIYSLICLITFFIYGIDKYKARNQKWRIPERTLLWLAFFGAPGALLGMQLFRHKTKHLRFQILVPVFFALHVLLWAFLVFLIIKLPN